MCLCLDLVVDLVSDSIYLFYLSYVITRSHEEHNVTQYMFVYIFYYSGAIMHSKTPHLSLLHLTSFPRHSRYTCVVKANDVVIG